MQGARYFNAILTSDHIEPDIAKRKASVRRSQRTKFKTYVTLNPTLAVHKTYVLTDEIPEEYQRIATSRLRLSSHRLAIETGRWSRISQDQRLCTCGSIQTENHVVCDCIRTDEIREQFKNLDFTNLENFFDNCSNIVSMCKCSYMVLNMYRWILLKI